MPTADIVALLEPLELAKGMTPEELSVLGQYAEHIRYEDGEILVDFTDTVFDLIVILEGEVEIRTAMNDLLSRLNRHCLIGEVSFIDHRPRSARAVSSGQCEAICFPSSLIDTLRTEHPQLLVKMLHQISLVLCQKLRSTTRFAEASFV